MTDPFDRWLADKRLAQVEQLPDGARGTVEQLRALAGSLAAALACIDRLQGTVTDLERLVYRMEEERDEARRSPGGDWLTVLWAHEKLADSIAVEAEDRALTAQASAAYIAGYARAVADYAAYLRGEEISETLANVLG